MVPETPFSEIMLDWDWAQFIATQFLINSSRLRSDQLIATRLIPDQATVGAWGRGVEMWGL